MTPPPFSWRREWPWLLLPALLSLIARLPIYWHAGVALSEDGDTSILGLMAWRIAGGIDYPLFYYGQMYLGPFEGYLAAPFVALLGPTFGALVVSQSLFLVGVTWPLLYRFLHPIGGRAGALVALLTLSVLPAWFSTSTSGRYVGYLSIMTLGTGLLMLGQRYVRSPTAWRAALAGLVVGFSYWINANIALFVAPLMVLMWYRGRALALWSRGQLGAALGRRRWRWQLAGVAVSGALIAVLALAYHPLSIGNLSLESPEKYLPRVLVLAVGLLLALEWRLATNRRRWTTLAAAFALGAAVGVAPLIVAKRTEPVYWRKAPTKLTPTQIPEKLRTARQYVTPMFLGYAPHEQNQPPALAWTVTALRALVVALGLGLLTMVLVAHRGELWRLLRLAPTELSPVVMLLAMGAIMIVLYLLHDSIPATRYFLFMWVPLAGMIAWAVPRIGLRWALPALAVCLVHHALGIVWWHHAYLPAGRQRLDPQLVEQMLARAPAVGCGDYYVLYNLCYLSGERLVGAATVEAADRMRPWRKQHQYAERVWLVSCDEIAADRRRLAIFMARWGSRIRDRWRLGPYQVFVFDKPPGQMTFDDQGN